MANTQNEDLSHLDSLIKDPKIRRIIASAILHSIKGIQSGGKAAMVSLIASFSAYEAYLNKTHQRVRTIKTFIDPTKPVSLLDNFVETKLRSNKHQSINQDDLRNLLTKENRFVISALAGAGKSVLMRYLALTFYENPAGKIPIFIDLRDLNRTKNPDLLSYIHATYKQKSELSKSVFEKALKNGVFIFFLDGYDEINFENRDVIQEQINQICDDYPKISIAISSRPDPKFQGWERFDLLEITPMSLKQVQALIEKTEYDKELKKRFLNKINSGLYERHVSFMSTPLLAILMMLTYEQNANIPEKMHLFYLRAFETLFDKHDTHKDSYERKRKTNLRIDEFRRLFSVLSFNTYVMELFEFSKSDLLERISDALEYTGINVDPNDILFDLTESICLIQIEGQFYSFVHRSFQEYFTAYFLSDCPSEYRDDFLDEFAIRTWDNVLVMLFDMSIDRIETGWVLPRIEKYLEHIENSKGSIKRNIFISNWKAMKVIENNSYFIFDMFVPGNFRRLFSVLSQFYPLKIPISYIYLDIDEVDEFSGYFSSLIGKNYRNIETSDRHLTKGKSRLIEFGNNVPVNSRIVTKYLSAHKEIINLAATIRDHKIIQQAYLAKVKGYKRK